MKLNPEYFHPGKHHLCMFCGVAIGFVNEKGGIKPMGNKAHVLMEKTEPGLYVINCCVDCAERVNFQDPAVLKQIRFTIVKSFEFVDSLRGVNSATIAMRKKRLSDVPKCGGFCRKETSGSERKKNIQDYKELTNAR